MKQVSVLRKEGHMFRDILPIKKKINPKKLQSYMKTLR